MSKKKLTVNGLPLIISVAKAASLVGMSREFITKAVRSGDIETVQIGPRTWVVTKPFLTKFGVDTEDAA